MALDLDEVPAKHITWDLVSEVPFPSLLGPGLGIVRLHPTLAWDTVLPYATLLVEGLESEGGDEQQERLLDGLRAMEREITTARDTLDSLRSGLEPAPSAALEVLDRRRPLCGVSDYRELHYEAQRGFGGPPSLKEVLARYERVRLLIHLAPDIAWAKRYLALMSFGRMHMELALARDAISARIDPEGLLHDPSLWSSIEESFGQMSERYAIGYAAHHESYNQEALELSHRLERLAPQVNALAHFGKTPELGEPVGSEVPGLFKDLSDSLHVCLVDGDELDLGDVPYCQGCRLRMDQDIARRDAEVTFAALDRTMREYNRRLGSHSVRRTLAHPNKEQLDKFVTLVQVADPSALANVLDDEVVAFLRRFLSACS